MAGGIFCIENWSGDLRVTASVRPLLEFLAESDTARFIHQRVDTAGELTHYLARFAALDSYRVGYLAMHGDRGRVYVGRHDVTLAKLAAWARLDEPPPTVEEDEQPDVLDLEGKVLYLGSCASLRATPAALRRFREDTGALLLCGYRRNVD